MEPRNVGKETTKVRVAIMLTNIYMGDSRLFHPVSLCSRATPPRQIARSSLDGDGAFVKLPGNSFTNLGAATIETWVKVNKQGSWSRVFDFGKEGNVVAPHTARPKYCSLARDSAQRSTQQQWFAAVLSENRRSFYDESVDAFLPS